MSARILAAVVLAASGCNVMTDLPDAGGVECADGSRYEGVVRFNASIPPSFDVARRADANAAAPPGWQYLRADKGCLPFRKGALR